MRRLVLIIGIFLAVAVNCGGCSDQNSGNGVESGDNPAAATVSADDASGVSEYAERNLPYNAYQQKCNELKAKYGATTLVEETSEYSGFSYLKGLCVVDLLEFNGDGVQDLLVIYSNGENTGTNIYRQAIPQAGTYEMEIWTCLNGSLVQLLYEPRVGYYCDFHTNSFDDDNCFVTIYENAEGLAVIQLRSEDYSAYSFLNPSYAYTNSYTNLYYSAGALNRDEFLYSSISYSGEGSFTMNGAPITESLWEERVNGYDKILAAVFLSSSVYSSATLKTCNLDYNKALKQTDSFVSWLSKSSGNDISAAIAAEAKVAAGDYISAYLQEIERANRIEVAGYNLYDLDQNGIPELIIKTGGGEANYMFQVYTFLKGKLINCGEFGGGHSSLYTNGSEGIIRYRGHMGGYGIEFIELDGTVLKIRAIAEGDINYPATGLPDHYPELDDFGYYGYSDLGMCAPELPTALYQYHW
jgi:hypothetical protein